MNDSNKANAEPIKLTDKDVRIVYLPPAVVAAHQYEGDDPEHNVAKVIDRFVLDNDLPNINNVALIKDGVYDSIQLDLLLPIKGRR
ncbi:MAG: hypothetical protein LBU61_05655 [Coriobacteriales bacterium]|jgi:hypothetical protein|nr:hypothetical protein [Coriobacteriales bacterium]